MNVGISSCAHLPALSISLPGPGLISDLPLSGALSRYYFRFPQSKGETPALPSSAPVMILLAVGLFSRCSSAFLSVEDNLLRRYCYASPDIPPHSLS